MAIRISAIFLLVEFIKKSVAVLQAEMKTQMEELGRRKESYYARSTCSRSSSITSGHYQFVPHQLLVQIDEYSPRGLHPRVEGAHRCLIKTTHDELDDEYCKQGDSNHHGRHPNQLSRHPRQRPWVLRLCLCQAKTAGLSHVRHLLRGLSRWVSVVQRGRGRIIGC